MAVRRLNPVQPAHFAFTPENLAWASETIAKYPEGKQASAIIPLLWRAQEQAGWLPEPAIRLVCDMLGMAYIRGLEVATFYTMFQLSPVGTKAHIQVCGTTPCMLRGSGELIGVCKSRIDDHSHTLNADGTLSWEEVECIGVCANAPVVQVGKDTYEDLTPEQLNTLIDAFVAGKQVKPGSQIGRVASAPVTGATTLTDPALYDGSTVGAWKKRFEETSGGAADKAQETAPASALASPEHKAEVAAGTSPSSPGGGGGAKPVPVHPAALTAMANAGLVKELEERSGGKALSADELSRIKADMLRDRAIAAAAAARNVEPELLKAPRGGKADDLSLISGVGSDVVDKLHAIGIWHFDQIAKWTPQNVAWFEVQLDGFMGRVTRDKWIEQAQKLASGWRPESKAGKRPKG